MKTLIKTIWLNKKARRMTNRLEQKINSYNCDLSLAMRLNPTIEIDARHIDSILDRIDALTGEKRQTRVLQMLREQAKAN